MAEYNPNRSPAWNYGGNNWKLSRSKIDLFVERPRCFYIDNKLGTKRPPIPSFQINKAVDYQLKQEFDVNLISYTGNDSWVEPTIHEIKRCLDDEKIPKANPDCDFCNFFESRKRHELK